MADCSFARCQQERRLIKRELMKWSKDMLHIVGLERVAEEFMGRRKWKHYQDQLTRSQLNIAEQQPISITTLETETEDSDYQKPLNHRLAQPNGKHYNSNNSNGTLQFEEEFDNNHTSQDHDSSATSRSSSGSPSPPPEPNDWTPSDKCNFCVNGRLLTVNAKGELVAETTATASIHNCNNNNSNNINGIAEHQHDSDSNSSASLHNSSRNIHNNNKNNNNNKHRARNGTNATTTSSSASTIELYKLFTQQAAEMTSMESMAAKLAQFTMMADFNLMINQQQQHANSVTPTTSEVSAAAASPALKDTPSPSVDAPLDLSSKPSPNSSISGDIKTARALSECATPISAARHNYNHEDLNIALQDVLVSKLSTRKSSKDYHVPRSTLRNKLCKMSLDAKRPNAQTPPDLQQLQHYHDLEQDEQSGEEAGDGDSNASTPAPGFQEIAQRIVANEHLRKLNSMSEHNGSELGDDLEPAMSPKSLRTPPTDMQAAATAAAVAAATAGGTNNATGLPIDANVLLHALVLASGIGVIPKLDETQTLGDLFKSLLMANTGGMMNETLTSGHESNGSATLLDQRLLQQQQQQQQQHLNAAYRRHLPKSETPETSSSLDANEACEDPILKIPSFKVSGAPSVSPTLRCNNSSNSMTNNNNGNGNNNNNSNSSNRNGDHSPHSASPMLAAAVAAAAANNSYRQSAGGGGGSNSSSNNLLSPSPTSIQKMMANTIQRKINEQSSQESLRNNGNTSGSECSSSGGGNSSTSRKPSISVAKMIGGTDTSRFGASPNLLAQQHHSHLPPAHHSAHQQQQQHQQQHSHHPHSHQHQQLSAQDLAAGKGTRPKRGKYRNYDRDSLVEAVKAVQRGEMSVHRAGSYYGVPHSTLEYKVKERHLMRPRKREPKPQPDLVGLTGAANKISLTSLHNLDKLKAGSGNNANNSSGSKLSNALKSSSSSSAASAAAAAAAAAAASVPNGIGPMFDAPPQLPFQPFWAQANAGANYGLDFNRNPDFIKKQLEEVLRNSQLGVPSNHHGALEYAENMYDGIIRKTLKNDVNDVNSYSSGNGNGNALLDQLLVKKTPLPFTNNRSNDYLGAACSTSESVKRAGSPMGAYSDIKRERLSPMRSADSASSDDDHEHSNNNNNNNNNNNSDLAHNKNNSSNINNNNNGNGSSSNNGNGRSRMTSRDSETDASSLKSEQSHSSLPHNNKMMDLNGSNSVKFESEPPPQMAQISSNTSILHEKLAQIKAEQAEVHAANTEEQL